MKTESKPNIVFIITDQQRFDTIAALGHDHVITPNLDRLVKEGTTFTRTYAAAPSCAPSRAALFSGLYPHSSGVLRNEDPWRHSWVEQLADDGYRCVNIGKMHTYPYETPLGFHERHVVENKDRNHPSQPFFLDQWDKALWVRGVEKPGRATYKRDIPDYSQRLGAFEWPAADDLHSDNFVGNLAHEWIDRYKIKADEPFFLEVGFPGPHPPYDPTKEALKRYESREIPLPELSREELESQPKPLRTLRKNHIDDDHDAIVHQDNPGMDQIERQRRYYYANVTMIDHQVGELMSALESRGVLDNTVIIFTSDHGDCLNDHWHSQKWTMYEESVHVPAIVWGRGVARNQRVDGLTSLIDFGPTILELAGIEPPPWMEAKTLLPAIRGEQFSGRDFVFSEHAYDFIFSGTELMTMVRDERWKLVEFIDSDEGQLFDMQRDPGEMYNLWDDETVAAIRQHLQEVIAHWRAESALRTATWSAPYR
ncbi:sulfatase-like hydrolase/transferase [Halomonas eurihalina]|uniref:Sulfatase-like hydrolase/transferase n=1 Tax=Halomonas eurihalina TaxID=42566 RepID=A0A5D9DDI1_HALER|nr:sulfatase-like hydrolase/transferase [Halomonas eurihalina]MDR5858152.1 sulfatase-like hydrolase/transferase [Halomonas eurihalina]TZG41342.1 sulfatase-like hydrolase/transferase [Halomonas eurihalina]